MCVSGDRGGLRPVHLLLFLFFPLYVITAAEVSHRHRPAVMMPLCGIFQLLVAIGRHFILRR